MKSIIKWINALLFPPRCAACGQLMRPDSIDCHGALCKKCAGFFAREMRTQCKHCFLEYHACRCVPSVLKSGVAAYIKLAPYGDEGEVSVTRQLVLGIKKSPMRHTFRFLGAELAVGVRAAVEACDRLREKEGKKALETVITYLPRSKRTRSRRGFDQAKELAHALSLETGFCFVPLLARVRDGRMQKTLTRAQRAENLRGAFAKIGEDIAQKRVLLVDDVVTTGAGMSECARVLEAAEIIAVSVAFTEKKHIK